MSTNLGIGRRRPVFALRHRMVLAREVADLEQADLAIALGVTRQTVSNYERGFTEPKRHMLTAWALATGVEPEWLVTGADRPDGPDGLPDLDSNQEPIGFQRLRSLAA